jgi:hypothetical protein
MVAFTIPRLSIPDRDPIDRQTIFDRGMRLS